MAKIYNSDVTKGLADSAGIQINTDKIPNELAEKIVPTFETNPEQLRKTTIVVHNTGTNATATTIYTTPANQDFYLTGYDLSLSKTAAAASARGYLMFTTNGVSRRIYIQGEATTALQAGTRGFLNHPIKIDRSTNIQIGLPVAEATISMSATIFGYVNESGA